MYTFTHADGRSTDVYTPLTEGPSPVVFFVHGGAWHVGKKDNDSATQVCSALAQEGFVCVSASYRLSSPSNQQIQSVLVVVVGILMTLALTSPSMVQMLFVLLFTVTVMLFALALWPSETTETVQHPQHIQDVAKQYRWTLQHAAEYGGDPNTVFVMGHSAGGHLVSLLSTNPAYLEGAPRPAGCVSISGVYSDKRLQETSIGRQILKNAFGSRQHYYDAFPVYSVTKESCPFLLINAGVDISTKRHSFDFHYALRQAGVFVQTSYFDDQTHWSISKDWRGKNRRVLDEVLAFLKECSAYANAESSKHK